MNGELKIGGGHYFLSKNAEYVKAAGNLEITKGGKIKLVDLQSGHYKPTYKENQIARELFKKIGLHL